MFDFQVYAEKYIGSSVTHITQPSGYWSLNNGLWTVINYRTDYSMALYRLFGWTDFAEATWHLSETFDIGSVILRTDNLQT